MATRRAAAKERTLAKLREAGRAVLLEIGVAQASIQDITARAGVATGTFYAHFPSKAAFVDALVEELNHRLAEEVMAILNKPPLPPAPELLKQLAHAVVEYWAANIQAIPIFADHLARHANEEILRIGTNKEAIGIVKSIVASVPSLQLKTSPEFLVANIVAMWRASGMLASNLEPAERKRVARDLAQSTQVLLTQFAPAILDVDLNDVIAGL